MSHHKLLSKIRAWSLGSFAALTVTCVSNAEVITPLDLATWPSGWTIQKTSGTTVDVTERDEKDYLRIARIDNGTGAIAFWNGTETISDKFGDFSGSVILQYSGGSNTFGFIVGATNKTYNNSATTNNQGYYIGVQVNSGLGIWRNTLTTQTSSSATVIGAALPGGGAWKSMSNSAMVAGTGTYQFDFAVTGATINATLWNLNTEDEKTGNAIATLSYTMAEDVKGYFGLFGGRYGSDNRNIFFRDLQIEAIPEPRVAMMGAIGVLLCLYRFRKNK